MEDAGGYDMIEQNNLSRRSFLTGAGLVAAG